MQAEREDRLEAKLEKRQAQREEQLEAKLRDMETSLAPKPAITSQMLADLQSRLEALHVAELLTTDELYTLEDMCCDVMELETTTSGGILTMDMAQTHPVITKACKVAGLSARIKSDVAFARQVRKRYL